MEDRRRYDEKSHVSSDSFLLYPDRGEAAREKKSVRAGSGRRGRGALQGPDIDIEGETRKLAKEFLAGDRSAFDRLIVLHQTMVYSLCFRLLGDHDDADDAAQEVFIRVYRYLGGFGFKSSFRTWLYRVTVNVCRSRLGSGESRMRKKSVSIESPGRPGADDPEGPMELPDRGESPFAATGRREVGQMIQDAIGTLPGQQRLVVVLKDVEGRSYEEIAGITGLKMGTVKSKLSRARLRLREILEGMVDERL